MNNRKLGQLTRIARRITGNNGRVMTMMIIAMLGLVFRSGAAGEPMFGATFDISGSLNPTGSMTIRARLSDTGLFSVDEVRFQIESAGGEIVTTGGTFFDPKTLTMRVTYDPVDVTIRNLGSIMVDSSGDFSFNWSRSLPEITVSGDYTAESSSGMSESGRFSATVDTLLNFNPTSTLDASNYPDSFDIISYGIDEFHPILRLTEGDVGHHLTG